MYAMHVNKDDNIYGSEAQLLLIRYSDKQTIDIYSSFNN